jgi:subtilisin family serine protease
MFRFTRSRSVLGAVVLAVAVGCSDQATMTAPARSFSRTALASRDAVPVSGTHIFALQKGVPSNFAALVAAKGGQVQLVQSQSKVAITSGLSDADAAALATAVGGLVGGDVSARWVPTAEEMNAGASSDMTATGQFTQSPLAATRLPQQWNMLQIHAPEAWAAGKTGSPSVRVAILDTGLDPFHQELFGVVDGGVSANCLTGTCVPGTTNWYDDYFHGTYVGGIVSANNFVTAGVAPNVRLVAVKVLNSKGSGSFGAILAGIVYAVDVAHARVINMSLGATFMGNTPGLVALQQALTNVIDYADSKGTVVVTSAGNDDLNLGNPHPHLSLPCEAGENQICVSATDPRDMIARYSNFGRDGIDVAAPGGDDKHIPRTAATFNDVLPFLIASPCSGATPTSLCWDPKATIHGFYIPADGTSASAPHVTGLAALIASQPGGSALTAAQIRDRIRSTSDDIGNQSKYGDGRINVARALGVQ